MALFNFLQMQRHDNIHFVAYFHNGPCAWLIQKLGIKIFHIHGIVSCYDPVALFRLIKFIRNMQPDVMHTSLPAANVIGRLIAKYYKIPLISDLHGDAHDHGWFRNMLERMTIGIPEQLVTVSYSVKKAFLSKIVIKCSKKTQYSIINKKLIVIQNGIDSSTLQKRASKNRLLREDLGFTRNDFIIGSVGRLEKIKSYDLLIRAFKILSDENGLQNCLLRLCLVGDGSKYHELESLAKQLDVARKVRFMGFRDDAYRFYNIFDCFVLSSQSEGLSIALLEAMSFGLPAIVTSKEHKHDVVSDGVNGFLVPPNDVRALFFAIKKLIYDKSLIASMKCENKKLINEKFNLQRMITSYNKLYQEVTRKSLENQYAKI